jgi:hypothetical protein
MLLVALLCAGCDSDDNAEGSPSTGVDPAGGSALGGGGFSCDREVEAAYCRSFPDGIWVCANLCTYDVDLCGDVNHACEDACAYVDTCDVGPDYLSWWIGCTSVAEDYSLNECIDLSCYFNELWFYDDTSVCL